MEFFISQTCLVSCDDLVELFDAGFRGTVDGEAVVLWR